MNAIINEPLAPLHNTNYRFRIYGTTFVLRKGLFYFYRHIWSFTLHFTSSLTEWRIARRGNDSSSNFFSIDILAEEKWPKKKNQLRTSSNSCPLRQPGIYPSRIDKIFGSLWYISNFTETSRGLNSPLATLILLHS